jgi:REP element-mobilizing transposase RayT
MDDYESLSHTKWDCKYHVVSILGDSRRVFFKKDHCEIGNL